MDNEVLEKSISRPSQIHPRRPKSFRLESFAPSTPQSAPDSPQEVQGDPLSPLQLLVTPLPEVVQTPPLLVLPTALSQIADIPTHKISVQPAPIAHVEQEKVMNTRQQKQYLALVVLWLGVNLFFWYWWFQGKHIGNPILFILMSFALFYEATLLPSFYTFYLGWMRRPKAIDPAWAEKAGVIQKVAVISLTVPGSEGLEFVKRQMTAMKNIDYPHDSWILVDKEHSPEIEALAQSLGVFYFSRHDQATWGEQQVKAWNQPIPPFKEKTKAGNVNSWIDAYGPLYSHFTQLDIDHIPVPAYLHKVLGFFLDPKVKWVQAPSVYGNFENWTARGSTEQEFVLQGPLQMGFFGFCRTPFIIGSHCTYDMHAVRQIGGFQPTRAEDHLDTVFLAAQGHQGVFLPEVIAVGDGPENFETYIAQQFAWAFSMIQVLFTYTAKCIKNYTPQQALQFLFVQTWYTFWSTSMLLLFTLPLVSLFTNTPITRENYGQFMLHVLPLTGAAFIIWFWSRPWHFPKKVGLSWRGILLHVARWPIVLSALIQVLLKVQKPYMITVKGLQQGAHRPFSLAAHSPYFMLIGLSLGASWFYLSIFVHGPSQGYLLFAVQGALLFLLIYLTTLTKDIIDMIREGSTLFRALLLRRKPLLALVLTVVLLVTTFNMASPNIYHALFHKKGQTLVQTQRESQKNTSSPLVTSAVVTPTSSSSSRNAEMQGPYHVQGNVVLAADGRPYLFHGIARDSLEYNCAGDGQFTARELAYMGSGTNTATATYWGANTVRLPLSEGFWLRGQPSQQCTAASCQRLLKQTVKTLTALKLNVILDLHWSDADGQSLQGGGSWAMPDSDSVIFWHQVAESYKSYPNVLFELYNEPHLVQWTCWAGGCTMVNDHDYSNDCACFKTLTYTSVGMQTLVETVRSTGATNLVLVAGIDWGYDLSQLPRYALQGSNIIYVTHPYEGSGREPGNWDASFGAISTRYAVVSTESGEPHCGTSYVNALLSYFDAHQIGWISWAWAGQGDICGYPRLILNYQGKPSPGLGDLVYQHLHTYL